MTHDKAALADYIETSGMMGFYLDEREKAIICAVLRAANGMREALEFAQMVFVNSGFETRPLVQVALGKIEAALAVPQAKDKP